MTDVDRFPTTEVCFMRNCILLSTVFILLGAPQAFSQSQCGFHSAAAGGHLLATGLDSSFNFSADSSPITFSESACFAVSGSESVTSYGSPGYLVGGFIGQYVSSVSYAASEGNLSLKLTSFAQGGYPYTPTAGGDASVTWNDRLRLVWEGAGLPPLLPNNKLKLNYQFSGSVDVDMFGASGVSSWIFSSASASASIFGQGPSFFVSKNAVWNPTSDPQIIHTGFGAEAILGPDLSLSFAPVLQVSVSTSYGIGKADAGNTLRFQSITFSDGTTPESLGYRIVFDSGITSPNLRAVPEPSTAMLLTLGIFSISRRFRPRYLLSA